MNTIKALFSNLLFILVLVMGAALYLGNRMLDSRITELATANGTINTLQNANDQQATELKTLQRQEKGLRQLLNQQNAALAELDQQNRKTADELQEALATPPMGRPNCAREPLPAGALRLLQPAGAARGDHPGDHASASGGASTALPGT